ncbi:MAG TPA: ATP-binding protein [Nitrospirota bacterium]|nr:ATP-binding protein [Nitrospirota bacterium]
MSLKKKIALSFFISAFIIAILAVFEYVNFIEIKKEIRYLEITDTLSRKSLQLRRHEKNYFLYNPQQAGEESAAVHAYLDELKGILMQNLVIDRAEQFSLRERINQYDHRFTMIEAEAKNLSLEFEKVRTGNRAKQNVIALVESTFLERPAQSADFLAKALLLSRRHPLITGLHELDGDILSLRKTGEDILVLSKDLDKVAREKTETVIRISQIAILIFFPLFFVVGIGMLFYITTNVVKRLLLLITVVEKTGRGSYPHMATASQRKNADDEVGLLIDKFNDMEDQLALHEEELERKNKELMQTKKLAAIGTLASGVAHELNNPLNNIYLSAQVLAKEAGGTCSAEAKEAIHDILGQAERVKRIVNQLLEFARGKEPQYRDVDFGELIANSYRYLGKSRNLENIRFSCNFDSPSINLYADEGQMEQVFTNLFANAVDAMQLQGSLTVNARQDSDSTVITIADTGRGVSRELQDKIFEPFFTTKDKGTGLGLAIVYNIIKKHNGDIVLESEAGKGTTFTITLPSRTVTR